METLNFILLKEVKVNFIIINRRWNQYRNKVDYLREDILELNSYEPTSQNRKIDRQKKYLFFNENIWITLRIL